MPTWVPPRTWDPNDDLDKATLDVEIRDKLVNLDGRLNQINVTSDTSPGNHARGTSFPGSPTVNDRFFRTDRGIQFFWNGTRWLSDGPPLTLAFTPFQFLPPWLAAQNQAFRVANPWKGEMAVWIEKFIVAAYVATTNNATNYWAVIPSDMDGAGAATAWTVTQPHTNGLGSTQFGQNRFTIGHASNIDTVYFVVDIDKTGTPGAIYPMPVALYRLIG